MAKGRTSSMGDSASYSSRTKTYKSPKSKKRSLRIRRALYSILVTLAVFVILYYLIVRPSGDISIVENGLGTIFTPIQRAATSVTEFVKSWFGTSESTENLEAKLEELRLENERLNIQINTYADIESENERLQVLLDAKETYEALSPIYAKVIAKDMGVWFDSFTINRGINDGISANMAVVNGDGLIGRIYEVGYNYAKVLSVIDARSSVSCLIGRTRDNGMMEGKTTYSSGDAECHMRYLSNLANVKVGDEVYTSGLDSLFPKGIYIGTVTAVSRETDSSDKYAVIHPAVNFTSIEDVFILRRLVETIDDTLPYVPTPTPKPIVTAQPTSSASSIYSYQTPSTVDDKAIWQMPTVPPSTTPSTQSTAPVATRPVPEAGWLAN